MKPNLLGVLLWIVLIGLTTTLVITAAGAGSLIAAGAVLPTAVALVLTATHRPDAD